MTDETAAGTAPQDGDPIPAPVLEIGYQYIKDLSFEIPGAPQSFDERTPPEVGINLGVQVNSMDEQNHEVVLHIDARGSVGDKMLFIVELDYAGVFRVSEMPAEHLGPFLRIEPPRLLFPFARGVIAGITRDGGLPPLMISPVDFVALFRQREAQRNKAAGDNGAEKPPKK